ncbi:HAD-IIB family hydrolase [Actibacterium sp. D379-3]
MIAAQPDTTERWLLVSDVDDTLTGDAPALSRLCTVLAQHRGRVIVALNSSRPSDSVDATLAQTFPQGFVPDAIITAMGTEIRVGGNWAAAWSRQFESWPRDAIFALVTGLGFRPHAQEFQTRAKASFAVPRGADQTKVAEALAQSGLPCRIIASGRDDLDILPPQAGKDAATRFLARELGIAPARVVAAGDSANDLALFHAAARAIAVGNARRELIDAMPVEKSYHARKDHAAGVLEGLVRWGVLPA